VIVHGDESDVVWYAPYWPDRFSPFSPFLTAARPAKKKVERLILGRISIGQSGENVEHGEV